MGIKKSKTILIRIAERLKRKKRQPRQPKYYIRWLAHGLGIGLLGMYLFLAGFHNMDLSQNMRWLEAEYNITLADQGSDGQIRTSVDGYVLGFLQLRIGFFLALLGVGLAFECIGQLDRGVKWR